MYKVLIFCSLFAMELHAQNSAPYALPPKSIQVLPRQMACLNINTGDDDPSDTVKISWDAAVQNAMFTHNNGLVQHASGQICWTPTKADASLVPYLFLILLDDGHIQVTDTFSITVHGIPERDSFQISKGACGERICHSPFNGWTDKVSFLLSNGVSVAYNMPVEEVRFMGLKPGMYVLTTKATSNMPAITTYRDTFYVTEGHDVTSQFETLSEPSQYRVTLTEHSGNPDVHYAWTIKNSLGITKLPDTLMQITVQVWEPSELCVYISSDQNCADTLCFSLPADPNGIEDLEKQARIYPNPSVDRLNIASHKPILTLALFDIQGKQVLQQEEDKILTTHLNVTGLPKGTFLLAIRYTDGSTGRHAVVIR